jgi:hypothetical protein
MAELGARDQARVAFEGALLFPAASLDGSGRAACGALASVEEDDLVLAFDLFAAPYVLTATGSVKKISIETDEIANVFEDLEAWAATLLLDYANETGWPLAHAWQTEQARVLAWNERLVPRQPFVLGGEYETSNLVCVALEDALEGYARMSASLSQLPDGAEVRLYGWPPREVVAANEEKA